MFEVPVHACLLPAPATANPRPVSWICLFRTLHINGVVLLVFCVSLLSLSITPSRFALWRPGSRPRPSRWADGTPWHGWTGRTCLSIALVVTDEAATSRSCVDTTFRFFTVSLGGGVWVQGTSSPTGSVWGPRVLRMPAIGSRCNFCVFAAILCFFHLLQKARVESVNAALKAVHESRRLVQPGVGVVV